MPEFKILTIRLKVKAGNVEEVKGQVDEFVEDFLDPDIATMEGEIEEQDD